jgi:GNAT superfamily N-acetyltransferase
MDKMVSMEGEVKILRVDIVDTEQLTEICKKAFDSDKDFGAPCEGGPPGYDSVDWNAFMTRNRFVDYYKILYNDLLVGGFIVGQRRPGYLVCERTFVDPKYQRKGIATQAFHFIWNMYPDAIVWTLDTPEWNTRTKQFYESIGFVQIGFTNVYEWRGRFYEKQMNTNRPTPIQKIAELRDGQSRVLVEGDIEGISTPRSVLSRKTGEPLKIMDALLADETGSISLVLWNDQIRQIENAKRIRIENGYVKIFRESLQLSVGKWGMIISLNHEKNKHR